MEGPVISAAFITWPYELKMIPSRVVTDWSFMELSRLRPLYASFCSSIPPGVSEEINFTSINTTQFSIAPLLSFVPWILRSNFPLLYLAIFIPPKDAELMIKTLSPPGIPRILSVHLVQTEVTTVNQKVQITNPPYFNAWYKYLNESLDI